jgi:hypothetical protein
MLHARSFRNSIFEISLTSNESYILDWITSTLDTGELSSSTPHAIAFEIHCESAGPKYRSIRDSNDQRVYEMDQPLTRVRIDTALSKVIAQVFTDDVRNLERVVSSVFISPLRLLAAHQGNFFIHGALVERDAQTVLLCGPSGSGKSSIGLVLAHHGYFLRTDENTFLTRREKGPAVFPLFTRAFVKEPSLKRFDYLSAVSQKSEGTGKFRFSLAAIQPENPHQWANPVDYVLFPRFVLNGALTIRPLSERSAIEALVRESERRYLQEGLHTLALHHFMLLRETLKRARAFTLEYDDNSLSQIPARIDSLLAERWA